VDFKLGDFRMKNKLVRNQGDIMERDGNSNSNHGHPEASSTQKNPFFTTLVVDAKLSFVGDLEEFLKIEGHFILRAETAKDAIDKTRQYQPDLILLDNELEGITGLALMGELLLEQSAAAVIMLATNPSITESVEAIKRGAVDYLFRPLDFVKLKQAIDIQKALFKT
jgi:DNA-binding NtrC family response regulator